MRVEPFEWTIGGVGASILVCFVIFVAGVVGSEAWRASEKAAAYKAYVECLREMKAQPIDVQQTFCGRIREQL